MGIAYADYASGGNDVTGIGGAMSLAGIDFMGGYTDVDGVGSGFGINAKLAGIRVAYEESDSYADPHIWGNYAIGLGGGARVIFEIMNDGTDTDGVGMLRFDF